MATRNGRKSTKETAPSTAEGGIAMILETDPQKTIEDAAQEVGCVPIRLLEMFRDRLNDSEAMAWDSVPVEHESLLDEFKRQLESEGSVRRLQPQEEAPQLRPPSPPVAEIPILEEEPEPPKKQKRKSTGLTKSRKSALQKLDDDTVTLGEGIHETELNLAAQEGIQDGAQIETTYLVAKQVTRNNVRKEAAKREVVRVIQKTARQKNYNPVALLEKHGLKPADEDLEELNQLVTPAVQTVGNATGEILDNSWINGLQIDCSELESSMSQE